MKHNAKGCFKKKKEYNNCRLLQRWLTLLIGAIQMGRNGATMKGLGGCKEARNNGRGLEGIG